MATDSIAVYIVALGLTQKWREEDERARRGGETIWETADRFKKAGFKMGLLGLAEEARHIEGYGARAETTIYHIAGSTDKLEQVRDNWLKERKGYRDCARDACIFLRDKEGLLKIAQQLEDDDEKPTAELYRKIANDFPLTNILSSTNIGQDLGLPVLLDLP